MDQKRWLRWSMSPEEADHGIGSRPRKHTLRSDGTDIEVLTLGSGPPVVFVHGAWNWSVHWLGVAEELADAYTCWVMDGRRRQSRS